MQIAIRYLVVALLLVLAIETASASGPYSDRVRPFNSWLLERDNDLFEVVTRDYYFLCWTSSELLLQQARANCNTVVLWWAWVRRYGTNSKDGGIFSNPSQPNKLSPRRFGSIDVSLCHIPEVRLREAIPCPSLDSHVHLLRERQI